LQARAIFEGVIEALEKTGAPIIPEIMVPAMRDKPGLDCIRTRIDSAARAVRAGDGERDFLSGRNGD